MRKKQGVVVGCILLALAGCMLFRSNPLAENRGALVLIFDTRTCGDLKELGEQLEAANARATVFIAGAVNRYTVLKLYDLRDAGHEIGLSGLRGIDPEQYAALYGPQKYFQDEVVPQLLGAEQTSLNPTLFLLPTLQGLSLPNFLQAKGFARLVHQLPDYIPPQAKSPQEFSKSAVVHAYQLTSNNLARVNLSSLAKGNKVLVVLPDRAVLPDLFAAARQQAIPYATVSDLPAVRKTRRD